MINNVKVVPKRIRLRIYKEVLNEYLNNTNMFVGLCGNLKKLPECSYAPIYLLFPELRKYYNRKQRFTKEGIKINRSSSLFWFKSKYGRIRCLREIIKSMSN